MSKRPGDGGEFSSPDDSLANYFDDLLGGEELLDQALATIDEQAIPLVGTSGGTSGGARVVSLPTKKTVEEPPGKSVLGAEPKPKLALKTITSFVEPVTAHTAEQKLKLEKLLQSGRTQLLVGRPVDTSVPTNQVVTSLINTGAKTAFISDAQEIQDWPVEAPVADSAIEQVVDTETATQIVRYQVDGVEWLENGRPQWAQSRFDVLLFKVSGLTLAVPLISLGQIQPLTDELTPLFGQADWFMGLQPTPAGKIRTVNTAKFVMPERYDEAFLQTAKYVVSIDGVPWGLAVDSVNQPITLLPDDVKWRGDRSKRPWLAGTVKEHMCALLDIPRIGQMLIDADKNFIAD